MDPAQPQPEGQDQQFLNPYASQMGSPPMSQNPSMSDPSQQWTPPPYGDLQRSSQRQSSVSKQKRPISVYLEGPYRYATLIIPALGAMMLMMIVGVPSPIGLAAGYYTGLVITSKRLTASQKHRRYLITAALVLLMLAYVVAFRGNSIVG